MLVLIFWWLLVFLHLDNAMKWKQASPLSGFHAEVQGSHVFVHKSKQTNKQKNISFRYLRPLICLQEQHPGESHPSDSETQCILV